MTIQEAKAAARNAALVHATTENGLVLAQVLKWSGNKAQVAVCRDDHTPDIRWLDPAALTWRTIV